MKMKQKLLLKIVRFFFRKPQIYGIERIDYTNPAVFVSNHLGAYGPVMLMLFFPFRLIPWVTHQITDFRLCPEYIKKDFIEPDLKFKPPFSNILASIIGPICVMLMKYLQAIPVYKKSPRLRLTFKQSLRELTCGRNLLIFPEISGTAGNEGVKEFDKGFINIAELFYEKTGVAVNFYPVSVDKSEKSIRIGGKIPFDPKSPLVMERERIVKYLRDSILDMYHYHKKSELENKFPPGKLSF